MRLPDSKDVIDKSFVQYGMFSPCREELLFMEDVEDCCPWGCRRYTHSGPRDLLPICISKLDEVVLEDNFKGFNNCARVVMVEEGTFICMEVCRD